jgi:hypothetical protein
MEYTGPGLIHFKPGLDHSFFKELTTPKAKWVRRDGKDQLTYTTVAGMDDHAHDCIRYADAAREFMHQDIDGICDQLDGITSEGAA